jgi:hypothetical protein
VVVADYAFYNTIRQVARWIGISVTKDSFAKVVSKVILILGGVFSGTLTAIVMTQMGGRLIKHLQNNPFNSRKIDPVIIIEDFSERL